MKMKTMKRVKLADNREVRITRIPTAYGVDLIRVGVNLLPGGENMSGAVFPAQYIDEIADALKAVK